MWRACPFALAVTIVAVTIAAAPPEESVDKPQYNQSGELQRPENYREWMFLSAGLGMNYSPAPGSHDMFTNVFVPRWAYKEFVSSGKWPKRSTDRKRRSSSPVARSPRCAPCSS